MNGDNVHDSLVIFFGGAFFLGASAGIIFGVSAVLGPVAGVVALVLILLAVFAFLAVQP